MTPPIHRNGRLGSKWWAICIAPRPAKRQNNSEDLWILRWYAYKKSRSWVRILVFGKLKRASMILESQAFLNIYIQGLKFTTSSILKLEPSQLKFGEYTKKNPSLRTLQGRQLIEKGIQLTRLTMVWGIHGVQSVPRLLRYQANAQCKAERRRESGLQCSGMLKRYMYLSCKNDSFKLWPLHLWLYYMQTSFCNDIVYTFRRLHHLHAIKQLLVKQSMIGLKAQSYRLSQLSQLHVLSSS